MLGRVACACGAHELPSHLWFKGQLISRSGSAFGQAGRTLYAFCSCSAISAASGGYSRLGREVDHCPGEVQVRCGHRHLRQVHGHVLPLHATASFGVEIIQVHWMRAQIARTHQSRIVCSDHLGCAVTTMLPAIALKDDQRGLGSPQYTVRLIRRAHLSGLM